MLTKLTTLLLLVVVLPFHPHSSHGGRGFLVGANIAIDLRVLGFAPSIPLSLLEKFFVVIKVAFVVNAVSGILLLVAYPTKALTNPLFYIKLSLIAAACRKRRGLYPVNEECSQAHRSVSGLRP